MSDEPKILVIDIETMAAKVWGWRLFKENHSVEQIIEPSRVICFAAQWLGEREVMFFSEWTDGKEAMFKAARDLLIEADMVVTFNGKKFDLPHLLTEFINHRIGSIPRLTHVDLQQVARNQFRFLSNRLAFVGPYLKIGKKIKTEGFELWDAVNKGDERAQRKMERYCKQDTRLTGLLYRAMKEYIVNHPTFKRKYHNCPEGHTEKRGFRYTQTMKIQRLFCKKCRGWYDGQKERLM